MGQKARIYHLVLRRQRLRKSKHLTWPAQVSWTGDMFNLPKLHSHQSKQDFLYRHFRHGFFGIAAVRNLVGQTKTKTASSTCGHKLSKAETCFHRLPLRRCWCTRCVVGCSGSICKFRHSGVHLWPSNRSGERLNSFTWLNSFTFEKITASHG